MDKEHGHSGSNWTCKHMHTWTHLAHWMPELTLAYLEKGDSFSVVRFSFVLIFNWIFMTLKKKKKGQNPERLSALPTLKARGSSRAGRQDTSVAGRGFFPALGQQTAQSYGNYWRLTVPEGLHPSIPVERAMNWIPERRVLVETGMAFPTWLMVSARKLVFNSFHGSFPYSLSG